jgi:hypothetical protein
MPYNIHWEENGVFCHLHGYLTISMMVQALEEHTVDPRYKNLRYRIADYTAVTDYSVLPSDMEGLATMDMAVRTLNPGILDVTVSPNPDHLALFRHFAARAENQSRVAFFETLDQARAWVAAWKD